MNKVSLIASFLLLIGSILRLSFFWQPSFTGDEAGHMMKAVSVARGITDFVLSRDRNVAFQNIVKPILEHNHPPLEFLILVPTVPFYPRELFSRLFYIVLSITTLGLCFFILKNSENYYLPLAFLALSSTSVYVIWFSQMITFGLNLIGSILLALSLWFFSSFPSIKSLRLLLFSTVFSLYVSVDFVLFWPAVILALFFERKQLSKLKFIQTAFISLLLLLLFYLPYIYYSFLPSSPKGAGFIHYQSYITANRTSQVSSFFAKGFFSFVKEKWQAFFSRPGIWTIWPFALLAFRQFVKKRSVFILSVAFLTILIFEVPLVPCCTVYLNLLGPLLLLSAIVISTLKSKHWIIVSIILINLFQTKPLITGTPNPITFANWKKDEDRIREVSKLVKPCLNIEETYISTEDSWRARYYFGRPMLPTVEYEVSSEEETIRQFLHGDLPQVKLIHVHTKTVDEALLDELKNYAAKYEEIGSNRIYFFKDC